MNTAAICTQLSSRRKSVRLTDFRASERDVVVRLLAGLPLLYPNADQWLARRLDDVVRGSAQCTLAIVDGKYAGVAIETPKPGRRVKLSTLFVAPEFRRHGLGTMLMRRCWSHWMMGGVTRAHVTVRIGREDMLHALLEQFGFSILTLVPNRYGNEQHEFVFHAAVVGKGPHELLRGSV